MVVMNECSFLDFDGYTLIIVRECHRLWEVLTKEIMCDGVLC